MQLERERPEVTPLLTIPLTEAQIRALIDHVDLTDESPVDAGCTAARPRGAG
ncbi:MAG: hypothetical protein R3F65_32430 [bacterium]